VLIHYGEMRAEDEVFSALMLRAYDAIRMERFMHRTQYWSAGSPVEILTVGTEGPGRYGVNRNVTLTILIVSENKVSANFALVQPSAQNS